MTDTLAALDDRELLRYLEDTAKKRCEELTIREHDGEWIAASWMTGLAGKTMTLEANDPDRRTAMLGLARMYAA